MNAKVLYSAKKSLLPVAAGALLAFAVTFAPQAACAGFTQNEDTAQLLARINQLENQVQTLSRAVYRSGKVSMTDGGDAGDGSSASASIMTNFEDRLSHIEQQQRQMTGQIEQMNYNIQQLQQKLDKAQADNEMRLQQLEGGGSAHAGAVTGRAPQTRPDKASQTKYDNASQTHGKLLGTMTASGGADSAETLYQSGFADVRAGNYDAAASKFRQFMDKYATHPLASNAQYWLGETYYVRGDYHEAAKLFAQDYQNYPQGGKAAASLLKLGMSLGKLGKKGDACLSFQQLKKEFPGSRTPEAHAADDEMHTLGCN